MSGRPAAAEREIITDAAQVLERRLATLLDAAKWIHARRGSRIMPGIMDHFCLAWRRIAAPWGLG
ncbi:MAG: hypothetical protein IT443_05905 [Phycisphaeraceae bacterium]|nr:hypothetical protein [Phycisphaeraceae bacterium]